MKKNGVRSKVVFGNPVGKFTQSFALNYKKFFIKKFGDDSDAKYKIKLDKDFLLYDLFDCKNIVPIGTGEKVDKIVDDKAIIIGNIRMGYGHYRIAMSMASCAKALGYNPYWFDLSNFKDSTCTKILDYQNKMYSLASRISQKSVLFNRLFWDPISMNYYKKIEGHAIDQRTTEAFVPIFRYLPKDTPYIGTHAFCSQGAVHAGMKNVVNAIPDNWPISIHYAEGSTHTVQTPSSYLGYKSLRGMNKKQKLKPMPNNSIYYVGHYVDHEVVYNVEKDCKARLERINAGGEKRYLLSIGGAGAQAKLNAQIVGKLLEFVKKGTASVFINIGDHRNVMEYMLKHIPDLSKNYTVIDNDMESVFRLFQYPNERKKGVYFFINDDIFSAVYTTNYLMRFVDCMLTKPSELAFYPVPKILIQRVGGHEMYGAIRASELGDGTYECSSKKEIFEMIEHFHFDNALLKNMCYHICNNKRAGIYDGSYNAVRIAVGEGTKLTKM